MYPKNSEKRSIILLTNATKFFYLNEDRELILSTSIGHIPWNSGELGLGDPHLIEELSPQTQK